MKLPFHYLIDMRTPVLTVLTTVLFFVVPTLSLATQGNTSTTLGNHSSANSDNTSGISLETATLSTDSTVFSNGTILPITSAKSSSTFLRGVNLGGWLVLEKWMNPELFSGPFSSATDQYTFDAMPGARAALQRHWETFFTEADIQALAKTGINALRIPIGYWAYDAQNTAPYLKGADVYMDRAIGWARKAGMKVWIDCHGSPGSQNGFDNSGHAGAVNWQKGNNMAHSITVLEAMALRYGSMEYADVVVGLQLTNEPISTGNNVFSKTQSWTKVAYTAVKRKIKNPNLVVVMHDAFQGATSWTSVASQLSGSSGLKTFGIDTHEYQIFSDADNRLAQAQHITKACGWARDLARANKVMPTFVGEWSAATNICVNPDGTTTAGTSCSTKGCQCQTASMDKWNVKMVEQVRRFVEAQLDTFESSTSGYFIWSAKAPGGWGFFNGIKKGVIPNPVTRRLYPAQCRGG